MPHKRYEIALELQVHEGDLSALAYALILACEEAAEEGAVPNTDPACMLIAHQISFAAHSDAVTQTMYRDLITACRAHKNYHATPVPEKLH